MVYCVNLSNGWCRHDNVQLLEKLKQLVLFIERKLEKKDFIQLSFYSEPDGPTVGNGTFKSSILVPGEPEAFYVGPPSREKLPKNVLPGSVLVGSITYGAVSSFSKKDDQNQHAPASYSISYLIPPSKVSVPDAGSLFVSLSALLFLWSCIICYTASSGLNPYSRSS
jgi:tripeptidyl-peptidase-2